VDGSCFSLQCFLLQANIHSAAKGDLMAHKDFWISDKGLREAHERLVIFKGIRNALSYACSAVPWLTLIMESQGRLLTRIGYSKANTKETL